jgi:glycerate 2-kinase
MLAAVGGLSPRDLVVCLISGGGSALVPLPAGGITLDEIRKTTQLLLKSGANIQEINAVRKHLSRVKGGQLARAAYPASVIGLLISDVVGDSLDTIASGPTSPDPTTFSDALAVIGRYGLSGKVPRRVLDHLKRGAEGKIPETPKPGEECFRNVKNVIVASNSDAIEAARRVGKAHGLSYLS